MAFMFIENDNLQKRYKPSLIRESFLDFMLSRQAMLCTPMTVKFYKDTLTKFLVWLEKENVTEPESITARHIREFLSSYAEKGCKDSYVHTFARSIRTFIRFLYKEEYIPKLVTIQMPRIGEIRLPVLSVEEVKKVLGVCETIRDKALLLLMVDTGLRRSEVCSLNWENVNLQSGICTVRKGKGKKDRIVVLGIVTRRALISYRRKLPTSDNPALFQTKNGSRLTPFGLRSVLLRLSMQSGIPISAHSLRRTFVVLSIKGGMSLAHIQTLMGHTTLKMTMYYARMSDDDLLLAHQEHGPVDSFLQSK
jgi:site-specific recombinase XerD